MRLSLFLVLTSSVVLSSVRGDEKSVEALIAAIEKKGGRVDRDEDKPGQPIIKLGFSFADIKDDDLACVKELPELQSLFLGTTKTTDKALEHVKGLKKLKILDISRTRIGDAGLAHLKEMPQLQTLYIRGSRVTEVGLTDLKKSLPKLNVIR